MRYLFRFAAPLAIAVVLVAGVGFLATSNLFADAQRTVFPRTPPDEEENDEGPRLPNGKLQRDAILKDEHRKNLEALREIQQLSGELIQELEADTEMVLSIKSLKKLEQLEKLSKQVKNRVRK